MSAEEKLREFLVVEGVVAAGVFSPDGEALAVVEAAGTKPVDIKQVGASASMAMKELQEMSINAGAGKVGMVHITGETVHIIVSSLNEASNPLKTEPGKLHINLAVAITPGPGIGMARMMASSMIHFLSEDFKE